VLRRALGYSFASSFALILCISALIREVPPFPEEFLAVLTTLTAFLMLATGPVAWQVGRANRARVRAEAADSLGRLGYVEAVGPLAAALFDWDRNVRSAASAALHQLLPRLGSDQMGQFGAETMHHLGRALAHPDGELVAKALTALGEIGTSHALPYVERTVRSGRTGRIREAADRVRAILEERKHRETEVGRLLRPSSTSGDNAATLVRPARSVAEQELDLYLRPSAAEDSSTN
jgi:HEAT repeat protein